MAPISDLKCRIHDFGIKIFVKEMHRLCLSICYFLLSILHLKEHESPINQSPAKTIVLCFPRDKRDKSNLEDFIIDGKKGETVTRLPGTVNGEQIVIQNCQDSNIYIFDYIATVSVDDCINCNIFLGPIKSSVFIRDCKQCRVIVACQQFRTRDCFQVDSMLLCATQPIIESSSRMKFGCFSFNYTQLEQHFKAGGLSIFNNNWSNIHDFTPVPGEDNNFTYIPVDAKPSDFIALPEGPEFESLHITSAPEASLVPQTWGRRRKLGDESCLVVFFNDGSSAERASKLIHSLKAKNPQCMLIQSKEIPMQPDDSRRVFETDAYVNAVERGPVIGLEFNCNGCVSLCQSAVVELMAGTTGLVFVSQTPQAAEVQVEAFYNFADMQMGI